MEDLKAQAFDLLKKKEELIMNYEFTVSTLRNQLEDSLGLIQKELNGVLEKINDDVEVE